LDISQILEARVSRAQGDSPILLSLWSYLTLILIFDTINFINSNFNRIRSLCPILLGLLSTGFLDPGTKNSLALLPKSHHANTPSRGWFQSSPHILTFIALLFPFVNYLLCRSMGRPRNVTCGDFARLLLAQTTNWGWWGEEVRVRDGFVN
jgi:hypothetical protein